MDRYQHRGTFTGFTPRTVVLALLTVSAASGARAADPAGLWLTEDRKAHVRVSDCGGAPCGVIIWLQEPNDPKTGLPLTDGGNPDPSKRNRPIIGVPIVFDMHSTATLNKWSGQLYDPRSGKTYNGNMILETPTRLKVQGCILFLCQAETWTRLTEQAPTPTRARSSSEAVGR